LNWESWLRPKNSRMAASRGRLLMSLAGVAVSGLPITIRSRTPRASRASPTRNWSARSSPTVRMRRLPRWSMSSTSCPGTPAVRANR